MVSFGQNSVPRRQSQRLGWRINGMRIRGSRENGFDKSDSWNNLRDNRGKVI